jgi:beta-mannosidase
MARTFARWRTSEFCDGGIVLAMNDMWESAGWGLIDSSGRSKAALHRLAQSLKPVSLLAIDNGLNGLDLWGVNDTEESVSGVLRVQAIRNRSQVVLDGSAPLVVGPHDKMSVAAETLWGRFADPTYAYRFGERPFDAVFATWTAGNETDRLGSALHCVDGADSFDDPMPLSVEAITLAGSTVRVTVRAHALARFVEIGAAGFVATQGQFDLGPGHSRTVELRPDHQDNSYEKVAGIGTVHVMNSNETLEFAMSEFAGGGFTS